MAPAHRADMAYRGQRLRTWVERVRLDLEIVERPRRWGWYPRCCGRERLMRRRLMRALSQALPQQVRGVLAISRLLRPAASGATDRGSIWKSSKGVTAGGMVVNGMDAVDTLTPIPAIIRLKISSLTSHCVWSATNCGRTPALQAGGGVASPRGRRYAT